MHYVSNDDFLNEHDTRVTGIPNSQMTRRGRLYSLGQFDRNLLIGRTRRGQRQLCGVESQQVLSAKCCRSCFPPCCHSNGWLSEQPADIQDCIFRDEPVLRRLELQGMIAYAGRSAGVWMVRRQLQFL